MKVVIIDYATNTIEVISAENINLWCLENRHNNDWESYLTAEHHFDSSNSHFMVTDRLTINYR